MITREADIAIGRVIAKLGRHQPVYTIGDLYRDSAQPRSQRSRRRNFREWLQRGGHFGYTASDTLAYAAGTAITWKASGGTYAITCTSLAAAASRQGVKSATLIAAPPNGGTNAVLPDFLQVILQCQHTSAPTAGGEDQVLIGFSDSATAGTDNPAGLSGTDAAGPNSDTFPQLVFAGSLIVSNNIGTGVQLQYLSRVPPLDQYLSPVIYNNTSTNFDATAGHTILTMVPYWRQRAA